MITIHFTLTYIELYLLSINIIAFIVYGYDKIQALKTNKNISRVSEMILFLLLSLGGIIGSFLSMIIFRHKIKKLSFMMKYITIIIIQISLGYYFLWN